MTRLRRTLKRARVQLRYLRVLLRRFQVTFILLAVVQLGGSLVLWAGHRHQGAGVSFPKAMGATYFLLMGQPTLEMPDSWGLMLLEALIPVLGIAVLADGLVRFVFLFFAKHRNDKEWISVQAHTLKNHVVLCGAGRIGYRVLDRLLKLGLDVVVVERNEAAPFVSAIRNRHVPLLIDDVRAPNALEATNIVHARAIVCATDDDLANLNIALDARRMNPTIRVVMRLFDDDLVRKLESAFKFEAFSTSALSAPAFAAAAIDASIRASFDLEEQMVVIGEVTVGASLAGRTVAQAQDEAGVRVLRLRRGQAPAFDPKTTEKLSAGDHAVVQGPLDAIQRLAASPVPQGDVTSG